MDRYSLLLACLSSFWAQNLYFCNSCPLPPAARELASSDPSVHYQSVQTPDCIPMDFIYPRNRPAFPNNAVTFMITLLIRDPRSFERNLTPSTRTMLSTALGLGVEKQELHQ